MNLFPASDPKKIVQELLYEAQREAIQHTAAAEHHQALATMFNNRIARLQLGDTK